MNRQKLLISNAVVLDKDKVLLVRRFEPELPTVCKWCLPGGKVKPAEDPSLTAEREVAEETGYHIKVVHKLPITVKSKWEYPKGDVITNVSAYLCLLIDRERYFKGAIDPKIIEVKWFKIKDIHSIETLEGTLEFIKSALEEIKKH